MWTGWWWSLWPSIYLNNLFVRVFSSSFSFVLPAYLSSSCPLIYLLNKKVWDFRAIVFGFGILGISSTWMVGAKHGEMWQTMWVFATPPCNGEPTCEDGPHHRLDTIFESQVSGDDLPGPWSFDIIGQIPHQTLAPSWYKVKCSPPASDTRSSKGRNLMKAIKGLSTEVICPVSHIQVCRKIAKIFKTFCHWWKIYARKTSIPPIP